jgi:hypothetical protein
MKRHGLLYLLILIGLIGPWQPLFSQKIDFQNEHTKSTLPFKFIHNLIVVQISINDSKPLNFILDSGVGPLIITDPALVDTLHAENSLIYRIRGRGIGPELEAFVISDIKVGIGKHASGNITAILLKDDPFQLSFFLGIPIHGIIGSDFFNSFKVDINYTKRRVTFYALDRTVKKRGEPLPIQIIAGKPYLKTEVTMENGNKDSLLLLIDTGAGHAVSLDLTDENKKFQPEKTIPANLGIGLSGPISGAIGRLNKISLGNFSFNNIITAFPHYEDSELRTIMTMQSGSIGGELLKRFTLFLDYSRGELYLKKNRSYKAPFEYDMSGIEIYALNEGGKNRFFINRIEENSPAELVGLKVDDEILYINLKDVKQYSLNDIYELLRTETKNDLIIQVLRGNEIFFKFLKLRRRI